LRVWTDSRLRPYDGKCRSAHVYGSDVVATDLKARLTLLASLLAAGLLAVPGSVAAQEDAAKSKTLASGSKTKATAASLPANAPMAQLPWPDNSAAREQILNSPKWQDTMRQFDEWLSTQSLYDAQEVEHFKSRLEVGIGRMTAAQLQWFLNDMAEKLQVLRSKQTRDASDFLAQTVAVSSPAYARQIRQKLPDLLTMTAAQVNQRLAAFASKRQAAIQMQQTFQESRRQQIGYNQAQVAAREQAIDRDMNRESTAAVSASKGNKFTPARDYFPNAGNDGPFGPGTSVGFVGGGYF
jgi:hypothetical protein